MTLNCVFLRYSHHPGILNKQKRILIFLLFLAPSIIFKSYLFSFFFVLFIFVFVFWGEGGGEMTSNVDVSRVTRLSPWQLNPEVDAQDRADEGRGNK